MSGRANARIRRAFGRELRAARRAAGLTQERLGARAGLSGKFVGEVERGEKSISLDSLALVARALGVGIVALVEPADNPEREGTTMRLRQIRKREGLTQAALAAKARFSREYVARLETGRHDPPISTLRALARALNVRPCELLKGGSR